MGFIYLFIKLCSAFVVFRNINMLFKKKKEKKYKNEFVIVEMKDDPNGDP